MDTLNTTKTATKTAEGEPLESEGNTLSSSMANEDAKTTKTAESISSGSNPKAPSENASNEKDRDLSAGNQKVQDNPKEDDTGEKPVSASEASLREHTHAHHEHAHHEHVDDGDIHEKQRGSMPHHESHEEHTHHHHHDHHSRSSSCECEHNHHHSHGDGDEECVIENTIDTEWQLPSTSATKAKDLELALKALAGVKGISLKGNVLSITSTDETLKGLEEVFKEQGIEATRKIYKDEETALIRIAQMDCPTEEGLIRTKLKSMEGVGNLQFNLMNRVLTVSFPQGKLAEVLEAIKSLGYDPELLEDDRKPKLTEFKPTKIPWWRFGVGIALAAASEIVEYLDWPDAVSLVLAIAAILTVGLGTYKKGIIAFKNFNFNMNALMTVAVTGAVLIGSWPEAAMVMVLFELSEAIEQLSLDRARGAIRSLLALAPETASVRQPNGSWETVKADAIKVGDEIRVEPGERLAVDGVVTKGDTTINQAPITGESLPVEKGPGDAVFAGTVNENAEFEYKATSTAQNSMPARIISAIETAQGARAPTQRFVDSFARVYTPMVFVLAICTAILPPVLFDANWHDWIYKALTLLVIACPCALVISTPVTLVTGLANAAKRGILIKGGVYLEKGRKLKAVALDKTGTITEGRPKVQSFEVLESDLDPTKLLNLAKTLADRNSHPVSQAVAIHAAEKLTGPISPSPLEVERFHTVPGQGVFGEVGGKEWYLGNLKGLAKYSSNLGPIEKVASAISEKGYSPLILAEAGKPVAIFGIADQVKKHSKDAIKWLKKLGVEAIMLSGDNAKTAERVGAEVGIGLNSIKGNLLPEDKQNYVHELAQTKTVGMVGDGINDAPALARSDIGFAMGAAGTDTAIETADVALMDDDLRKLPAFVELSKATFNILCENIFISLAVKFAFLVLTYMGLATMWMAVFADTGVCLIVVANGLRLLGWKPSR